MKIIPLRFKLKKNICRLSLAVVFLCSYLNSEAQHVPVHVDNTSIYEFLDELAGVGAIEINSAVKPYSRKEIALLLKQASLSDELSVRQKDEVVFYLNDFGKALSQKTLKDKRFDLFYYRDSLFRITVNPILGMEVINRGKNNAIHRRNGGMFYGSIGSQFGFYGSLRDNYESVQMGGRPYLVNSRGAIYKGDDGEQDYSEARGGITWSWKWGNVGLHKDHYIWGNGYNGANVFSGNTPSHAFFSFNLKPAEWFEFQYMHGWLVSGVVDSARSFQYYDGTRQVFADKYLSANLVSVRPVPHLCISFGNSIVYADTPPNPAFMIPLLFYKSVDHTYNGASNRVGHNAQMFFDISSRQMNNLHLYSTVFVDEISFNRMFDKEQQSNYVSFKAGGRLYGLLSDFVFTVEYTRNNPMVFQHIIPTTTWASNGYNMGHYLKDNSDEQFFSVQYRPVSGVKVELSHTRSRKGKDYQAILEEGNVDVHPELNVDEPRWGIPFMSEVRWKNQKTSLKGSWQIIHDGYVYLSLKYQNVGGIDKEKYSPAFFSNEGLGARLGFNYGF
jgi:hypothetical protein